MDADAEMDLDSNVTMTKRQLITLLAYHGRRCLGRESRRDSATFANAEHPDGPIMGALDGINKFMANGRRVPDDGL